MPPVRASGEDQVFTLRLEDDTLVRQWRFDALLRLGVDAVDADRLDRVRDVHHLVADLVAAGCPPHVAVRIVL